VVLSGRILSGRIAMRTGNLYAGLAIAGVALFMSATLVVLLPKEVHRGSRMAYTET